VAGYVWAWVVLGFLDKWGGERGTGVTGERNFFFPCLCVSRGRRRPTVSFKTTPF